MTSVRCAAQVENSSGFSGFALSPGWRPAAQFVATSKAAYGMPSSAQSCVHGGGADKCIHDHNSQSALQHRRCARARYCSNRCATAPHSSATTPARERAHSSGTAQPLGMTVWWESHLGLARDRKSTDLAA